MKSPKMVKRDPHYKAGNRFVGIRFKEPLYEDLKALSKVYKTNNAQMVRYLVYWGACVLSHGEAREWDVSERDKIRLIKEQGQLIEDMKIELDRLAFKNQLIQELE